MATGQTLSTFDAMLKEYYSPERVESLVYPENALMALTAKSEKFPGSEIVIPALYGNSQAASPTFSYAQTLSTTDQAKTVGFHLTRVTDYGICTISTEAIEASDGDDGAFLEAKTVEIDSILSTLGRRTAIAQYRGGWGKLGVRGSASGATITLATLSDIHNFEKGMRVQFAAAESTGALLSSAGYLTVLSVNRNTGVVTFTSNVSGISGGADGDTIFAYGARQDASSPVRLMIAGLEAWCPATAPSASESYFGVDRSVDSRLYGTSYNGASDAIEDALIEGAMRAAALGQAVDHGFLSFAKYSVLEKNLHDLSRFVDVKPNAEASFAFRGIKMNGPRGVVTIIPDQNCPSNRAFLVKLAAIKFHSPGKLIRTQNSDGLTVLRQSSDDGVEVRCLMRGNMAVHNTAAIANVQL